MVNALEMAEHGARIARCSVSVLGGGIGDLAAPPHPPSRNLRRLLTWRGWLSLPRLRSETDQRALLNVASRFSSEPGGGLGAQRGEP